MSEILLIEDNPSHARLAILLLEHAGHSPWNALNAELGLDLARQRQPALILMDLDLPGSGGLETLRVLKTDPATAAIPVLATSVHSATHPHEAHSAGATGFIAKPYSYVDFIATVNRALNAA